MSDPNTLGSLVRKRRLESGYSLGQLASKVGKTAAEVRAWERGAELPEHGIISRLASTLEIDLGEIQKRLDEGRERLEEERRESEEASAIAAAAEAAEKIKSEPDEPVDFPDEKAVEAETEDDLPGATADAPSTPPTPGDEDEDAAEEVPSESADDVGSADLSEPELDLLDAPTEAVPVPIITETATAARASRAAAVLEEPPPPAPVPAEPAPDSDPGLLRYLEPLRILFDPRNRYLYWIRAGLTAIIMLVFAVILLDQLGELLDAFGELLDTIEPTAPDPDSLDV